MARNFNLYAILPVLVIATAVILSFLCVFAGNTPSFMHEYPVLTLNTTRLGQNAVEKIDGKIMGLNISRIVNKRSEPASVLVSTSTITSAPSTLITMAPRDIDSIISGLTEDAASLKSDAGDAVNSVQSAVESKATAVASAVESEAASIAGVVASKVSSVFASAQTAVMDSINNSYSDFIDELDLKGFYAIHMRTTCEGEYVAPDGANVTVGGSPMPPNGTHMVVDSCSKHSALNLFSAIRVLFVIGIFFTSVSLLLSVWGTICFSRKLAILNVLAMLPALGFLALASLATHGIAVAAANLINFVGGEVGLEAAYGGKFIVLAWATTILVLVSAGLWTVLAFVGERLPTPRRGQRSGGALPEHEMKGYANESPAPSVGYGRDRI